MKGFWSTLFGGSDDEGRDIKVRENDEDRAKQVSDRYTDTGGGKHIHESSTLDTASGSYKEYRGGENSDDRSYNKGNNDSDKGQSGKK